VILRKDHRVGVFIDTQNMYYSAKNLFGRKVNFETILETAVADRRLVQAIAYVVRATGNEQSFFDALKHIGIETKERELQVFPDGTKKANWDVGITVDAIRFSVDRRLDVVVLVSGDGDFVELAEYLKSNGRRVEVLAFRGTTAYRLMKAADRYVDLSQDRNRYLLPSNGDPAPLIKSGPI